MLTQRESAVDLAAAAAAVERTLLMIPGPTAISAEVLAAGARAVLSHGDPRLRGNFADALASLRRLFDAPSAQPVIASGSGTLGMEIALANFVEPGDRVLILETGVFGGRFKMVAERSQTEIKVESAPLGRAIDPDHVRRALASFRPKVMTITHVDTSTGVRVDPAPLVRLAHEHDALAIVDGVCSIGGEEYHGDAWDVDVGLTASQKAIGAPPGLAVVTVNARARAVREARKSVMASFFADLKMWLPVMESYEGTGPLGYFGTPAVTLIPSLVTALGEVEAEGLEARIRRHARVARAFKDGIAALGLASVAAPDAEANTLTVVRYPDGIGDEIVDAMRVEGVTVARSIHPDLRGKALRVGHMGASGGAEVLTTLAALERGLDRLGHPVQWGASLAAAQKVLARRS